MLPDATPTPADLRLMLDYDSGSGSLRWRWRPVEMFDKPESAAKWNNQFAGTMAFQTSNGFGYLKGKIWNKPYVAHRVAWAIHHGKWPDQQIDHINGNRSDNRIENLREVSPAENQKNQKRPVTNTSGRVGVIWFPMTSRWQVRIGKQHIGYFKSFERACSVRSSAEAVHGYHENHGRP